MRFAIQHGVGDPAWQPQVMAPANVTSWARQVERSGFDAIGFTDHPAPSASWLRAGGEGSADAITALAFCAAATTTVKLLTFVWVLPYRNPFLAAHQIATLDVLSAGRAIVGAGTGYLKSEFFALGADPARRTDAFDEAWATMTQVWSGEEVTVEGTGFSARGIQARLTPVQQPPPLWVHGNSQFGIDRAARLGAGWLGTMTSGALHTTMRTAAMPDLAAVTDRISRLRRATEAAGRDPRAVDVRLFGFWPMLDARQPWNADQRIEELDTWARAGVDGVVLMSCGDDVTAADEAVQRFGEEVIQALAPLS